MVVVVVVVVVVVGPVLRSRTIPMAMKPNMAMCAVAMFGFMRPKLAASRHKPVDDSSSRGNVCSVGNFEPPKA